MDIRCVSLAVLMCLVASSSATTIWTDIISCVRGLANETETAETGLGTDGFGDYSVLKLMTIICRDQGAFVRCLDEGLKQSNDSMAQTLDSLFDAQEVSDAYRGLCANISAIEQEDPEVLSCLSGVKLTSCQNKMADYFFYMGVVKKFAPPTEQLSRETLETLLCSITSQRRECEAEEIRKCNPSLGDVMDHFYRQTRPGACQQEQEQVQMDRDNEIH